MQRYLRALELQLLYYARRAGIKLFAGVIAAVLVSVGLIFVVMGLWHLAVETMGPVAGAMVLGLVFIGLGVVTLMVGTLHKRTPPPLPPPVFSSPKSASIVALVEAFFLGVSSGKSKPSDRNDD